MSALSDDDIQTLKEIVKDRQKFATDPEKITADESDESEGAA